MIRINLLPVRAKKKRNTSIYQLVAMGGGVVLALLCRRIPMGAPDPMADFQRQHLRRIHHRAGDG